jgi:hypothetical protein
MVPATVGVHAIEYGAVVTGAPIETPLAKNATELMVAPVLALAEAETVTAVPTVAVALLTGELMATVVTAAAAAVTLTAEEVMAAPLESVTRAVSAAAPVAVGVQFIV